MSGIFASERKRQQTPHQVHERTDSHCRIVGAFMLHSLSTANRKLSSYVDPKDAQPPTSATATSQAGCRYLYCIPGTYTYIFFGTLRSSLRDTSSYATALISGIAYIDSYIKTSGDGNIPSGEQYVSTDGTGVLIYAEDGGGHHLTWGVFGVGLQGLNAWMANPDNGYSDATFQINDGKNEVGNGYIGAENAQGACVFANAFVPNTPCVAVDREGLVFGYNGGTEC